MIPTKDKTVTPKVTETVINPMACQNRNKGYSVYGRGRKHLDDAQLRAVMAYPESPPNRRRNKKKNQSVPHIQQTQP